MEVWEEDQEMEVWKWSIGDGKCGSGVQEMGSVEGEYRRLEVQEVEQAMGSVEVEYRRWEV